MNPPETTALSEREWASFTPTGASILLSKSLPQDQGADHPGREAAWILTQTLPLLQPTALDFRVCHRSTETPFLVDSYPGVARWHMRRSDTAAEAARPAVRPQQERVVPQIGAASLELVLQEALAQPSPIDLWNTFEYFSVQKLRARLLRPDFSTAPTLSVRRGRWLHEVVVEHGPMGAWVEQIPDGLERPLEFQVDNSDGAVTARLSIAWSLWKQEGTPEHAAVVTFAKALQRRGYQVREVDPEFATWVASD